MAYTTCTPPAGDKITTEKNEMADQVTATKIMNRAAAIRKETPSISHPTSVIMAQREMQQEA